MSLTGEEENYQRAYKYLCDCGLEVQSLVDRVSWDRDICTQCGACTALCPSHALQMQYPQMTVSFDGEKCVVCRMCLEACPVGAVKVDF
jgi:ferredoxin